MANTRLPMRRRAAVALAGLVATALLPTGSAQATTGNDPSRALLDGVGGLLDGILGDVVPTGWLFDSSVTTMPQVRAAVGANALWTRGYKGKGVGIALIDTGVVPVAGLASSDVSNGPDLSFESQSSEMRHFDTFGHGTHMAGIIAGDGRTGLLGLDHFQGVAPAAKLTSLKVATSDGAVDVSQVIAAVDWVVAHRKDDPLNPIRVLNLSFGTDGVQRYQADPLTHAVENAWRAGIVVVVSGGNEGPLAPLNNPAYDPYVIAVGAADTRNTAATTSDDLVMGFSSRGDATRRVDLTAPGRSIASLRDPGSYLDSAHASARYGDGLFKGSGTSQAAAVVSGGVALLLQQRPALTPDQVKALLTRTASPMPLADVEARGAGELNLAAASLAQVPNVSQTWPRSAGTGSLEQSRGTQHVADGETELTGEFDIRGAWNAATWARRSTAGTSWNGGNWNGRPWAGSCWCDVTWTGATWSSAAWTGRSWAGRSWAGRSWAGRSWAGRSWAGGAWAGRSWAGRSWAGVAWQ